MSRLVILSMIIPVLLLLFLAVPGRPTRSLGAEPRPIRLLVWDEQQPEQKQAYENFLGNQIARYLGERPGLAVRSAALADPDQGLSAKALDAADVLIWWGHRRHGEIKPELARDIVRRITDGRLGLIALHSAHWSRPFVEAMDERARLDALARLPEADRGAAVLKVAPANRAVPKPGSPLTPSAHYSKKDGHVEVTLTLPSCVFPSWRADGKPSTITTLLPDHPIAKGIPARFTIPHTEMYSEPFHVPEPDQVVFEEKWEKGEHFRSGCVWNIGKGTVFYFRPEHETFPVYKEPTVLHVIENAVRWVGQEVVARTQ